MLIAAGTMLEGKYRIERLLGAGGMGSVWIAEHTMLNRPVAVKVLDSSAAKKDATAVTRFLREAQTAARLRSDHIVDVLDVGKFDDGTPYLIMELLEGETLSSRIKRETKLAVHPAALLVDQLLQGLGAAHGAGVIHRDIKPDNCFIIQKGGSDHLKLLDFGISKVAGDAREKSMTRTGVVMGTPYYMAPEQARGSKEVDHRCDLYAAGAILYECVTGRVPFEADTVNELLFKIVLEPLTPPRVHTPDLDPAFEQVILRAMAREAAQRYQTAQEFRDALGPFLGRAIGSGTVIVPTPAPGTIPPPGSSGAVVRGSHAPVSGIEQTAPIDSDALREAMKRPSASTPSGVPGFSATGPLHLSEAPQKSRMAGFVAAAAIAILAIGGGVVYLAASRDDAPTVTTGPANAAPPAASSLEVEPASKPQLTHATAKPIASIEPSPPPPASASTTNAPVKGSKAPPPPPPPTKKGAPTASTPVVAPPPPPPATTSTTPKPGSPRPIDTAL